MIITITEEELSQLVLDHLENTLGIDPSIVDDFDIKEISVEVGVQATKQPKRKAKRAKQQELPLNVPEEEEDKETPKKEEKVKNSPSEEKATEPEEKSTKKSLFGDL